MTGLVTLVISLLAGVIVITMTCPPVVAIITVVGICFVGAIVAKAMGKL
jgi:xanthosine utilization system XapX-like protein